MTEKKSRAFKMRIERRDKLDKLITSSNLTPDGANFLRKGLDPFHDFDVKLRGIPDTCTPRTIIQEVTKTVVISNVGLPSLTTNWDVHIASLPELMTMNSAACIQFNELAGGFRADEANQPISGSTGAGHPELGPFVISKVNTGGRTFPTGVNAQTNSNIISAVDFSDFESGQKRLIAAAFEIHDTTSNLNQQGSVVVYRMPQSTFTANTVGRAWNSTYIGAPTPIPSNICKVSKLPPPDVASCLLLEGSRQWESKKGAYCVCTQNLESNTFEDAANSSRIFEARTTDLENTECYGTFPTRSTLIPTGQDYYQLPTCHPVPFHTSGAYFIGLSPSSTLTAVFKLIYETAPTPDQSQLVVLAQPSASDRKSVV